MRVGNSTVSNEVFMGLAFACACIVYLVLENPLSAADGLWRMTLSPVIILRVSE